LFDCLPGDPALGSNHWCPASELAPRECSRPIDKVSVFHSLKSLEVMRYLFLCPLRDWVLSHFYWSDSWLYLYYHWRNVDGQPRRTVFSLSSPFTAVSVECSLYFFFRPIIRTFLYLCKLSWFSVLFGSHEGLASGKAFWA
jgi:hypothetical protein